MALLFTALEFREKLKKLVADERKLLTQILDYLKLVEDKKWHLEWGFSSLFDYCTKELEYSEAAAQRRIQAMRLMKSLPEVRENIVSGKLSLTVASQAQGFFKQEDKRRQEQDEILLKPEEKKEIVGSLLGLSKRQAEIKLTEISPEVTLVPEKVKPLGQDKMLLQCIVDSQLMAQLEQLLDLTSHSNPDRRFDVLIGYLAEMGLKKLDPARKTPKAHNVPTYKTPNSTNARIKSTVITASNSRTQAHLKPSPSNNPQLLPPAEFSRSRYIPSAIRQEVWRRDKGRCSYEDPCTRKTCSSTYQVQVDHIHPYSHGGETSLQNLRLLCAQHNRWRN